MTHIAIDDLSSTLELASEEMANVVAGKKSKVPVYSGGGYVYGWSYDFHGILIPWTAKKETLPGKA